MDSSTKVSTLERVAEMARSRVDDALKSTVERELVADEFFDMMAPPQHSKFEHVVASKLNDPTADKALTKSVWGSDSVSDDRIKEFAERLAAVKSS